MPIAVTCPSCKSKLKAPDNLVGKKVKCPGCQTAVLIPFPDDEEAPAPRPAVVAKAPVKKKPANDFEDLDDITDEPPRRSSKAVAKGRRPVDDEVDEIEDEDEDDDRPRRKGKGKGKVQVPSGPTEDSERTMAMLLYLSGFIVGPIGPLVLWMIKRKESKFVDHHGKEWLNYTITQFLVVILLGVIFGVLTFAIGSFVSWMVGAIVGGIGALLFGVYGLTSTILMIVAAIKAKGGTWYRFPMCMRMIK
jgi:uncharacterized Tic20 family protein